MSYNLEDSQKEKLDMIKKKKAEILKLFQDEYENVSSRDFNDIINLMMPATKEQINSITNESYTILFNEIYENIDDPPEKFSRIFKNFCEINPEFRIIYNRLINTITYEHFARFEQKPPIKMTNLDKLKKIAKQIFDFDKQKQRSSQDMEAFQSANRNFTTAKNNQAILSANQSDNQHYNDVKDDLDKYNNLAKKDEVFLGTAMDEDPPLGGKRKYSKKRRGSRKRRLSRKRRGSRKRRSSRKRC